MDKVFEKTRELAEALLETEQYANMKAAEDKAMQNREAAELMSSFIEKRTAIQTIMQSDNPDPVEMKRLSDEMDDVQEKLQLVDDIVGMNSARGEFNALIAQINQVLQFIVTGRMDDGSSCSGSCETCHGCH